MSVELHYLSFPLIKQLLVKCLSMNEWVTVLFCFFHKHAVSGSYSRINFSFIIKDFGAPLASILKKPLGKILILFVRQCSTVIKNMGWVEFWLHHWQVICLWMDSVPAIVRRIKWVDAHGMLATVPGKIKYSVFSSCCSRKNMFS